jgi:hypothetical protein
MENTMQPGFIGVGNIDTPMCRHLIETGHTIMAHDVSGHPYRASLISVLKPPTALKPWRRHVR